MKKVVKRKSNYEIIVESVLNMHNKYRAQHSAKTFKVSQDLNKIGFELAEGKRVKWLPADFKKNGGYEKSLDIVRKYGLYFQHYCGCKFSIRTTKEEL